MTTRIDPDGSRSKGSVLPPRLVFPGSFAPLHAGHRTLAAVAARFMGDPVHFEISIRNVDKPDLVAEEIERRVEQFREYAPVWITQVPTFPEKALLFPGATFVLGFDTAMRLFDIRYYQNEAIQRDAALAAFAATGSRFLVGGRVDANGRFQTWSPRGTPFDRLFTGLPEELFRVDLSSTLLRQRNGSDP
ncbi:MAG: hypothetical protein ACRCZF_08440 [Gemmataceae bacterium]